MLWSLLNHTVQKRFRYKIITAQQMCKCLLFNKFNIPGIKLRSTL